MSVAVRSTLFAVFEVLVTPPFALLALLTFPLPAAFRYGIITAWSRLIVWGAETICGIRYRVLGAEHIPAPPFIVLAKHQSAWETLAFQNIFPRQTWVVKRELLWVPFFGWGLAMLSPIAIDRSSGARALRGLLDQGRERLARGVCIIMFPEGTRMAPRTRGPYHAGGAWLATQTRTPVLPVAHDAGTFWPRKAFLKYPGCITVSIGPPISPQGLTHDELNGKVEDWIESEMEHIGQVNSEP